MAKRNIYTVTDAEAGKIVQKAFTEGWLFTIHLRSWGNRRKVSDGVLEEKFQEDAERVHATRTLIDSEPVKAITRVQGEAKAFVAGRDRMTRALPWFSDSTFWISGLKGADGRSDVEVIDERMVATRTEIERLKGELRRVYPELVQKALREHPKLYQPGDFPEADRVVAAFGIQWRWQKVTMPLNGEVGVVDKAIVERENKKYVDFMKGAVEDHVKEVRAAMGQMLLHLRDVLKDPTKKFQDSTVENPKKFLAALAEMSVPYYDKPFQGIAGDVRDILEGVYGQDLRDDGDYRKAVAEAMDDVVKVFKALPTVQIERAVDW